MATTTLDLRDLRPPERHSKIFEAFDAHGPGESLEIINDHEPAPLYYQMVAEIERFDADGYAVEQLGPETFVATLPKK